MTKEQPENVASINGANDTEDDAAADKRERSTIQFPYNDLDDAMAIAKAVHDNAGLECTVDQLAAYVKQSITSGAFRVRLSTAATFGLTENERGNVKLTDLGRYIADPAKEAEARAEAFMRVPLYARIYDNYKGFTLPPAAALEKFMREVGVSSKQTDRARQAFVRSARQAGYFAHGEDRLVRPAGPGTKPIVTKPAEERPSSDGKNGQGGGGGDGGDNGLDPLIGALVKKLPKPGSDWSLSERVVWLKMMAMAFNMTYATNDAPDEGIEVKKVEATN